MRWLRRTTHERPRSSSSHFTMRRQRQEAAALGWMQALPDAVLRRRPVLSVHLAGALLSTGQIDGIDERLNDVEQLLELARAPVPGTTAADPLEVADEAEFRALPSLVALYRSAHALAVGDAGSATSFARRALDLAEQDAYLVRGAAAGLLGLVHWSAGDLEAGYRWYAESTANLERAGYVADTLGCAVALADIRIAQGRRRDAMRTYEVALERAAALGGPTLRGTSDMFIGLSEQYRERGEIETATQYLDRSLALGEFAGLPQSRYRWHVAMSRIMESRGDLDGAVGQLDEAERVYTADFFPNVRPIAALRARVWIRQGNVSAAERWAVEHGVAVDDDLDYVHEFAHVTLARLLLRGSVDGALPLLDRLLHSADEGQRTGSVVEVLLLQALGRHALGDTSAALAPLERALALAEPEGCVRTFVDEGAPMAALLTRAGRAGVAPHYVARLLAAFDAPQGTLVRQPLVDPLSGRELEVLRLLRSDLDGPQIARELVVSLHTVRSHTKSIYAKLGVNNRRAAVRRGVELNLFRTVGTSTN